ncbi:hypothetical protein C7999DRAFT_36099 [Corynascus novoguineensis]|uniref:Uncharacterized protein n=1 Tax=Corynascus novoguineensis TaxID=1126955 RepID=A0AAN7HIS6_9PEZI|nr:hypothetical protein C7999DRAFT_36099 [Corynascus novoguineensis]
MPPQLLPASAAAFAPRASSIIVVLGSKVEPWLRQTLKRINKIKRPFNSAPESELRKDADPLVEALFNYQVIHLEAYVVHVDMVLRNDVAYKLTPDTIESLIEYHKNIHCVDAKANTYNWSEKEQQCKKLHEDFVQAINKFVFRTHVSALEGLEGDGAGELLGDKSEEVKNGIMGLIKPLLPPPPMIVDVVPQPPLLPSTPAGAASRSQPPPSVTMSAPVNPTPGLYYSSSVVTAPILQLPLPSMLAPQCGCDDHATITTVGLRNEVPSCDDIFMCAPAIAQPVIAYTPGPPSWQTA